MNMVTVGIDLAKNVFALHGVDQSGKAVFIKPKVARGQLLETVANLPPCLSGMEACSGDDAAAIVDSAATGSFALAPAAISG